MTPDQFADKSLDAFERRVQSALRDMMKRIRASVTKLQTSGGSLEYTSANLDQLAGIYQQSVLALQESGYYNAVNELQGSDKQLISTITANSKVPMAFTETSRDVINSLRNIQTAKFADIGLGACEAVKDVVTRAILTGQSIESTLSLIEAQLDNKLKQYAWTYANTTRKEVIQAVHWEAAKEYEGETFWQYFGPDDDITRPACQVLLARHNSYYTEAEMLDAEAEYADERAYNCRHYFVQIPKEEYEKNVG